MPRFGRPNATGRSSGKLSGRQGKLRRAPAGEPWVWLTRELLLSPAWRGRSILCVRLIEFLLIEYMNHAGTENGNLPATYDQLVAFGMSRRLILRAITEAEALGLIRVEHGGRWAMTNRPSIFTLTFYADKFDNPATNDWKRVTNEQVKALRKARQSNVAIPNVALS